MTAVGRIWGPFDLVKRDLGRLGGGGRLHRTGRLESFNVAVSVESLSTPWRHRDKSLITTSRFTTP